MNKHVKNALNTTVFMASPLLALFSADAKAQTTLQLAPELTNLKKGVTMEVMKGPGAELNEDMVCITYRNEQGDVMEVYARDGKSNKKKDKDHIIKLKEVEKLHFAGDAGYAGDYTGTPYFSRVDLTDKTSEVKNYSKFTEDGEPLPADTKAEDKSFEFVKQGQTISGKAPAPVYKANRLFGQFLNLDK